MVCSVIAPLPLPETRKKLNKIGVSAPLPYRPCIETPPAPVPPAHPHPRAGDWNGTGAGGVAWVPPQSRGAIGSETRHGQQPESEYAKRAESESKQSPAETADESTSAVTVIWPQVIGAFFYASADAPN